MSFASLEFLLFLPAVFLLYCFLGRKARWLWLLLASYGFYAGTKTFYLPLVLLVVTLITYGTGLLLGSATLEGQKRKILAGGVSVNLLALAGMKYLTFFIENLNSLSAGFSALGSVFIPPLIVSIGVSFFIFQAISYLVDIYLEIQQPERHFGYFALSLAFFPKLLQGPIERSQDLLVQLKKPYLFDYDNVRSGLLLFAFGLFKKIVVADRLGIFVDAVYGNPHAFSGIPLIMATLLYAFQLYFDFSGYTDMALGSARLFNIRLSQNFNSPYMATSIADFWRRWHMTFSRWILDYIFRPLQMHWRNWGTLGTALALLITFLLSGLWHGAAWGFVLWGAIHGLYLACSVFWKPYQKRIYKELRIDKSRWLKIWQTMTTFLLICFAWIFFRAGTWTDSWYVVTHLFSAPKFSSSTFFTFLQTNFFVGQSSWDFYEAMILLMFMGGIGYLMRRQSTTDLSEIILKLPTAHRWATYLVLFCGIVFGGIFDNGNFIYYQF